MTKFSTGDAEWTEWSFDFKMLVKSISPLMARWFDIAETTSEELTSERMQIEYLTHGEGANKKIPVPKELNIRDGQLFSVRIQ